MSQCYIGCTRDAVQQTLYALEILSVRHTDHCEILTRHTISTDRYQIHDLCPVCAYVSGTIQNYQKVT